MSKDNIIIYLHGFRSSPASHKAQVFTQRMIAMKAENKYFCPQLPASPAEAIALTQNLMQPFAPEQITLIGSSLGGYYATWLAEKTGCSAVLLNPMTRILPSMDQFIGVTTAFHSDEPFEFKPEFVDELRALAVTQTTRPERYFLIAATGDELLDWRDMTAHYPGSRQIVMQGGDHSLTGFEQYLDQILSFCGMGSGAAA